MVLVIFRRKKAPAASRQLEENALFPYKNIFFQKNKVSFSGAIFPPKVFPENYKKMEAAAAAAVAAAKKTYVLLKKKKRLWQAAS